MGEEGRRWKRRGKPERVLECEDGSCTGTLYDDAETGAAGGRGTADAGDDEHSVVVAAAAVAWCQTTRDLSYHCRVPPSRRLLVT